MIEFFTPWYGWHSTCIRCGRRWCDGEWMPLPFMRGARKQSVDEAKKAWRLMKPRTDNHFGLNDVSVGGNEIEAWRELAQQLA